MASSHCRWLANWLVYTEGKEIGHSTLVSGRLNKQGTYIPGWSWVLQDSPSYLPARNVKFLQRPVFSQEYDADGLKDTWRSQGCVLENSCHHGTGGQNIHSKDRARRWRRGVRSLQLPKSSRPLDHLLQQLGNYGNFYTTFTLHS